MKDINVVGGAGKDLLVFVCVNDGFFP